MDRTCDSRAAAHGGDEVGSVQLGDGIGEPRFQLVGGSAQVRWRRARVRARVSALRERAHDDRGHGLAAFGDGQVVEVQLFAVRLLACRNGDVPAHQLRPPSGRLVRPGLPSVSQSSSAAMTIWQAGRLARIAWATWSRLPASKATATHSPVASWMLAPVAKPSAITIRSPGAPMANKQPCLRPPFMNSLPPSASMVCRDQISPSISRNGEHQPS